MTRYEPTSTRNREGRPKLTARQQALADELQMRATAIRAASRGAVSIQEAVDLAAVDMGLEIPQFTQQDEED